MARPQLDPYVLGTIKTKRHPTNPALFQARAYFRDRYNVRREVTASDETAAKAKRALQRKVADEAKRHQGGDSELNERTTVAKAALVWLDHCKRKRTRGKPLAASTISEYAGIVKRYVTGSSIENLTVAQVNDVGRITAWLAHIADENGEGAAQAARKVLSGLLALAEQRGAIDFNRMSRVATPGAREGTIGANRMCRDEDCDLDCGKRHSGVGRALAPEEWVRVDQLLREPRYQLGEADIDDLVHFLFGTGARIREALHRVAWKDLDLDAQTVHVRGTKSPAANRVLRISDELTERLIARKEVLADQAIGQVFGVTRYPSKAGQPRDVSNVLRQVTRLLARADLPWAGSHTFRRTVATWMDEGGAGLAEIANQLGHASVNVTAGYLGRKTQPTRASGIMVTPRVQVDGLGVVGSDDRLN